LAGKSGKSAPGFKGSWLQLNCLAPFGFRLIGIAFQLICETKLQMAGEVIR
jgi:hypothetical protein